MSLSAPSAGPRRGVGDGAGAAGAGTVGAGTVGAGARAGAGAGFGDAEIDEPLLAVAGPEDGFVTGARVLRTALHQHVKGVAVITAGAEEPVGFCATSLAPVSVDPPMLSFAVSKGSASWAAMQAADHVMVHLLADDQEDLARRFGGSGEAKFGPATGWGRGARGLPVLDSALAWLLLALVSRVDLDDHALVIGRVVAARGSPAATGRGPLLHYSGRYGQLARHAHHCACPSGP